MTDYGMPENAIDTAALDRAWTEERVRRANALANDLHEAALHPGTDPRPMATKAGELSDLLYELGIHLDETAGTNITGYEP